VKIQIEGVNVVGARVTQEHSRAIGRTIVPRAKLGSDVNLQRIESEQILCACLARLNSLDLPRRPEIEGAAVRTPRRICDAVGLVDPLRPLFRLEVIKKECLR
jgi:hypothetical protein